MKDYLKRKECLEREILRLEQDIECAVKYKNDALEALYRKKLEKLNRDKEENDVNLQLCQ